jgi:hypothetical protein
MSVGIIVCSDGWKRKAAMQGKPLINVMVLKPDGGAIFLKVLTFDGKAMLEVHFESLLCMYNRIRCNKPIGLNNTFKQSTTHMHARTHTHAHTDASVIKDAEFVARQQEQMALEAAGGKPESVNGVLMDNPPVNRKALKILEAKHIR